MTQEYYAPGDFPSMGSNTHFPVARQVAAAPDGLFVYYSDDGLAAIRYVGAHFFGPFPITGEGPRSLEISRDGLLFTAGGWADISPAGHGFINCYDGTVFIADGAGGLRVYRPDGLRFVNTAHAAPGSWSNDVLALDDGTVLLACGEEGLIAYRYAHVVGVDEHSPPTPIRYVLGQNYPNPFNPVTTIPFSIPSAGPVLLTVHDPLGRIVAKLVDASLAAGNHQIHFNAANLTTGMYICRLRWNDTHATSSMLLLK